MRAKLVLYHRAIRPFLNPAPARPNHRHRIGIFRVNERDTLPQTGELIV
jgi:hypothetical protein